MAFSQFDLTELVSRLEHDVSRTLGPVHRGRVHDTVAGMEIGDVSDPDAIIVDAVQQALHDEFVDTTWPACPRHHRHPLWYRNGQWWCEQDGAPIASLGELELGSRNR